jgi:hypothetical protein
LSQKQFSFCYNPYSRIQEIDPYRFGVFDLRTSLIPAFWLLVTLSLASCGSTSSSGPKTSGVPYRAFVSNSVNGGSGAGLLIVNAETDLRPLNVGPISAGSTPGMMVVTPNRAQTLVVTSASNCSPTPPSPACQFSIISNAAESNAANLTLPGFTESVVISPDSSTAYVAVPNAKVENSDPGAIELYGLGGQTPGSPAGEVDIPSVQYLAIDNGGDRLLAFSPNSTTNPNSVAVVTPSNLGTSNPVVTYVVVTNQPFDHPVQAFFSSDDTTAYVINCGPECGGSQASIQTIDMTTSPPTAGGSGVTCLAGRCLGTVNNFPAGSVGLVNGTTMYVAGTPYNTNGQPSQPCTGQTTAAQTCGVLSVIDLSTLTVVGSASAIITDGYHNRIALGPNGQLFIGARTCTEIIPSTPPPAGAEVRGCLSIYNTLTTAVGTVPSGGVVIPPANGDVTGIQPIANRDVVYLVQGYPTPGGSLFIYCTVVDVDNNCPTADGLQTAPANVPTYGPLMVGSFYDVKTVDF